ncbi:MAG: D-2-hydroxyacid dehydrogenase [Clostridia bacterium]|nr:D-2-hydroxyacid dehydrogenase [Clostridia bacterium]
MKMVVLDGYALNPGDNPWDALAALGELTVYDRTTPGEVISRAADAEILFTNKTVLGEHEFAALPRVRYVGVLATGYNVVDIAAAEKRGITVTNVPTYGTASVAEHTFALILELCRHAGAHDRFVQAGGWSKAPDYSASITPQTELFGKCLGLVGFGRIARRTAEIARAFGMNILSCTPHPPEDAPWVEFVSLAELLRRSDILSMHCPAKPETVGMCNADFFAAMKPTAFFINTSRGQLVEERALRDALESGGIAGAALDVLSEEPPGESLLIGAKNCIVTPHIAWATLDARRRLMAVCAENLAAYLAGAPTNCVTRSK